MQILFIITLVLNFLAEAMAAVALISGPDGIAAAGKGNQWPMHYGFAVIAIASAIIWVWPHRTNKNAVTAVLGILLTFHAAVFTSLNIAGDQQAGVVIHGVLLALCGFLFTQRSKWCVS